MTWGSSPTSYGGLRLTQHSIIKGPTLCSDYWTELPDKKLLERKLHDAVLLARESTERKSPNKKLS